MLIIEYSYLASMLFEYLTILLIIHTYVMQYIKQLKYKDIQP